MQPAQLTIYLSSLTLAQLSALTTPLPALQLFLQRADRSLCAAASTEHWLYQRFGVATDINADLPAAAVSGLADGLSTETDFWLRADPVQFQADQAAAYLIGNAALTLTDTELTSLRKSINELLHADQLALFTPHATRWYLRSKQPLQLTTASLLTALLINRMRIKQHLQFSK